MYKSIYSSRGNCRHTTVYPLQQPLWLIGCRRIGKHASEHGRVLHVCDATDIFRRNPHNQTLLCIRHGEKIQFNGD